MSDTLYIQTEQNVEVHHPHVYLQDIAKLSCSNAKILNRLRVMPVANLDPDKPGRYVICAMDLIKDIQQKEPDLDITNIGEPTFIITYQKEGSVNVVLRWCKVIFVCLATSTLRSPGRQQTAFLFWRLLIPSGLGLAFCSSSITLEK